MLEQYFGRQVVAETDNRKIFRGPVIDYCTPDENDNQKESIIIRDVHTQSLVELYESDLKSIEIMK